MKKSNQFLRSGLCWTTTLASLSQLFACIASSHQGSILPTMRHPMLVSQDQGRQQAQPNVMPELSLSNPTQYPRCTLSNRHPLLNRCTDWAIPSQAKPPSVTPSWPVALASDSVERRFALVQEARRQMQLPAGEQTYRKDCSGFVLAVLSHQGAEQVVPTGFRGASEGDVSAIYRLAQANGLVHQRKVPNIGDLVFFSDTYDRNRDGRRNDPLTHMGIVERVDADGTVTIIHRVKRGVLRYKMNLFHPGQRKDQASGKVLNHFLRAAGQQADQRGRLTGELFHSFASTFQ